MQQGWSFVLGLRMLAIFRLICFCSAVLCIFVKVGMHVLCVQLHLQGGCYQLSAPICLLLLHRLVLRMYVVPACCVD